MATQFEYKCENCDFKIYTDEFGSDCTNMAISQLFVCKDCKQIMSLYKPLPHLDPNDYSDIKGFYRYGEAVTNTCPECRSKNTLTEWSPKDGCPKCGSNISLNPFGGIMETD